MLLMLPKGFFSLPSSKYRLWSAAGSLGFGIVGVFLGISIIAAFLETGTLLSAPGSFFGASFGGLALIIPAFFLYAAFILAEPKYQPEHIFILGSIVFPFFTLALGFFWIREFESLREISPFIARAGRMGIGFFAFFLVSLEVLVIVLLRLLFFKREPAQEEVPLRRRSTPPAQEAQYPEPHDNDSDDSEAPEEEPSMHEPPPDYPEKPRPKNLNDIYTEAAAAIAVDEVFKAAVLAARGMPAAAPPPVPAQPKDEYIPEDIPEIPEDFIEEKKAPAAAKTAKTAKTNADVEKALAEAAAIAEEEAARQEDKKSTDSAGRALREKKRRMPYFVPVEGILKQYPDGEYWVIDEETRNAALTLKETFKEFNIQVEVTGIRKGPVITMFEILPAPGIRLTKIEGLADNIALRLAAQSVRIVAPIPGKHAVGIEVPNAKRSIVSFREIIEEELGRDGKKPEIPMVLGKDITGEAVTVDLVQMPHLLIAGSTGSGKSVCVNSMILTILYQKAPTECRLILIDPKIV
ncbi:MAG: FtsK/SpoIIIE domain-containing protein, partial [Treponema sp.]|nr:FtsK/SpoIIIE domain-containing protein [Treponema sp.]